MNTTLIRNADLAIAWDATAKEHTYLADADIAFRDGDALNRQHPLPPVDRADEQGLHR